MVHLLQSGIPLLNCLHLLAEQKILPVPLLTRLIRHLEHGRRLSDALLEEEFPDLFVSFIRAAEEHGDYMWGFRQCQSFYQAREQFVREIKKAYTYPLFVFLLAMASFLFFTLFVLPRFRQLYQSMGIELPVFTRWLLDSVAFLPTLLLIGISLLLLGILGLKYAKAKGYDWHQPLLYCPVLRHIGRFRFTHYVAIQLGSLLRAGVPLLTALELVACISPWGYLSRQLRWLKGQIAQGLPMNQSIKRLHPQLFVPSFARLIAIGETSGRLDESLLAIAKGTEMLIKEKTERWLSRLEPALICLIGFFIAFAVLILFLPLLQLVQSI